MTTINEISVPTCAELAEILKSYGDKPLFSGNGWLAVTGFNLSPLGIQISVKRCCKPGMDAHTPRS